MILNVPDINDHEQLAANREELISETRARLSVFENRYELASSRLHAAIDQGVIRETAEVTSWLIAWGIHCALLEEWRAFAEWPGSG